MEIRKKTRPVWITSDGKEFDSELDASAHVGAAEHGDLIEEYVKSMTFTSMTKKAQVAQRTNTAKRIGAFLLWATMNEKLKLTAAPPGPPSDGSQS